MRAGVDPFRLVRVNDPSEFDIIVAAVEKAEELAKNERQDLAVRIARAMNGKSTP